MHNIVHFEIGGTDLDKAAAFYGGLFGWTVAEGPVRYIAGGGLRGHLNALGHGPETYTVVYVGTDDIDASLAQATALGGKALLGPVPLPNGAFAWFSDPNGTVVGLWQDKGLELS